MATKDIIPTPDSRRSTRPASPTGANRAPASTRSSRRTTPSAPSRKKSSALFSPSRRRGSGGSASPSPRALPPCCCAVIWLFFKGIGVWGITHARRVGLRHHQLRLVDRYRPRRHPHLRHPAALQAELAKFHQPVCRSDDTVRRRLRRHVPLIHTGRPWLAITGSSPIPTP